MSPVDTFEHLILCGSAQELVPFLLQLSAPEEIVVRQKAKRLKRTLEAIRPVSVESWGSGITQQQRFMLLLAALKTYTKKEAFSSSFDHVTMPAAGTWEYTAFWLILEQARPPWLLDLLLARAADKNWATPDYALVRELELRQFFTHRPALSAASLPSRLQAIGNELSVQTPVPSPAADVLADQLGNDALLVGRDLYLLFDFDTSVDSAGAYVQAPIPASQHASWTFESWPAWNKAHPAQQISWLDMFTRLVSAGQLSREQVLTRSLAAMQRDFRRPLLTWFKNLLLALRPTLDERLARQSELIALLAHPQAQVVHFALDQLKDV